jgi:hypothetical protein
MWGMVGFAVAVRVLIWAALTYAPHNINGPNTGRLLFSCRKPLMDLTQGSKGKDQPVSGGIQLLAFPLGLVEVWRSDDR